MNKTYNNVIDSLKAIGEKHLMIQNIPLIQENLKFDKYYEDIWDLL